MERSTVEQQCVAMCHVCERLAVKKPGDSIACSKCGCTTTRAPIPTTTCRGCDTRRGLKCISSSRVWENSRCLCGHSLRPEHMLWDGCPRALQQLWETARSETGSCFPLEDYLRRITPSEADWERQAELDFEEAAEDDRMLRDFLASKLDKERERARIKEEQEEQEELVRAAAAWELAEKEKAALVFIDYEMKRRPTESTRAPTVEGVERLQAKQGHQGWKGVLDLEGASLPQGGTWVQLGAVIIWDPASPRETRKEIKFQLPVNGSYCPHECVWTAKMTGVRWGDLCTGYTLVRPVEIIALLRRELAGVQIFAKGIILESAFMHCSLLNGEPVTPLEFHVFDLPIAQTFNEYMITRVLKGEEEWPLRNAYSERNGKVEGPHWYKQLFTRLGGYKYGGLKFPIHLPHRECQYFAEHVN
jgi:hypothetical protein